MISRLHHFDDDGHAIKLGRAALICQNQLRGYGDRDWVRLRGDEVWMKVHHMIVDSVAGGGAHWVRTTGLEEAWKVCFPFLWCPRPARRTEDVERTADDER